MATFENGDKPKNEKKEERTAELMAAKKMKMDIEESIGPDALKLLKLSTDIDAIKTDCEDDERLKFLFDQMMTACKHYTIDMIDMTKVSKSGLEGEEYRTEMDEVTKTQIHSHDSAISSVQSLARNLEKANKDTAWVKNLGPAKGGNSRLAYGKFAINTTYNDLDKIIKEIEKEQMETKE